MGTARRIWIGGASLIATLVVGTGVASASVSIAISGSTITVDGTTETTGISDIDVTYNSGGEYFFIVTTRPLVDGDGTGGCIATAATEGFCSAAGGTITALKALGGAASEAIRLEPSGDRFPSGIGYTVSGGRGVDNLNSPTRPTKLVGGGSGDTLNGDTSKDELLGKAGADTLSGFSGNDTLIGGTGKNDTFNAGEGDDFLDAQDGKKDGLIDCSDGTDTVVYDIGLDPDPFGCEG